MEGQAGVASYPVRTWGALYYVSESQDAKTTVCLAAEAVPLLSDNGACTMHDSRHKGDVMKRIVWLVTIVVFASALGFGVGLRAAAKAYQFTGTVKANEGGTLTVEKNAKETWTFSTDKDTKGTAKAGDKVTVYYKMIATEIEAKAPPTTAKKPAK
jgi:hypothetical protein